MDCFYSCQTHLFHSNQTHFFLYLSDTPLLFLSDTPFLLLSDTPFFYSCQTHLCFIPIRHTFYIPVRHFFFIPIRHTFYIPVRHTFFLFLSDIPFLTTNFVYLSFYLVLWHLHLSYPGIPSPDPETNKYYFGNKLSLFSSFMLQLWRKCLHGRHRMVVGFAISAYHH